MCECLCLPRRHETEMLAPLCMLHDPHACVSTSSPAEHRTSTAPEPRTGPDVAIAVPRAGDRDGGERDPRGLSLVSESYDKVGAEAGGDACISVSHLD